MIDQLISELRPYYNENLNYYNKYSYLLTFVNKVPIMKYAHCSPMMLDNNSKQYISFNDQIYKVCPSNGNLTDSFLTCMFQEFNTKYSLTEFLLNFKEFKIAFYNDLKYNLKKGDKKLKEYCEKFNINSELFEFIAKRYSICISIMNDKCRKSYGNENKKTIIMKIYCNKFHRLNKLHRTIVLKSLNN